MKITSSAFANNETIPAKYTCDGANVNPPLYIEDVSKKTKSMVLIVNDPDAPAGDWVHWTVWNIKPTTLLIRENSAPAESTEGLTDFGESGYGGPCPPVGREHHYHFKIYAINKILNLGEDARKDDIEDEIKGHILEQALLIGLYERL